MTLWTASLSKCTSNNLPTLVIFQSNIGIVGFVLF